MKVHKENSTIQCNKSTAFTGRIIQAEGAGLLQAGEEEALERSHHSLPVLQRRL